MPKKPQSRCRCTSKAPNIKNRKNKEKIGKVLQLATMENFNNKTHNCNQRQTFESEETAQTEMEMKQQKIIYVYEK